QKEDAVARHDQDCHGRGQQTVEKSQAALSGTVLGSGPVAECKQGAGSGDQEYGKKKEGRQRIDRQFTGTERQLPGKDKGCGSTGEEEGQAGRNTCQCRQDRRNGCDQLPGAGCPDKQAGNSGKADKKRGS